MCITIFVFGVFCKIIFIDSMRCRMYTHGTVRMFNSVNSALQGVRLLLLVINLKGKVSPLQSMKVHGDVDAKGPHFRIRKRLGADIALPRINNITF